MASAPSCSSNSVAALPPATSELSPLLACKSAAAARTEDLTVVVTANDNSELLTPPHGHVLEQRQRQRNVGEGEHEDTPPFGHEHYSHRAPWLRAAVLGANDGLVSTTSLMLGIAAADDDFFRMILTGVAGLVGGALSMACGEFVSVHSQKDAEESDVKREREEFLKGPAHVAKEMQELAEVYEARGLSKELAFRVAEELHATSDLDQIVKVHIRDEMGIDTDEMANPVQAAGTSACSFAVGASLPLAAAVFCRDYTVRIAAVVVIASLGLLTFGMFGAVLGGAPKLRAAFRVLSGGWLAMAGTYGVGYAFGITLI